MRSSTLLILVTKCLFSLVMFFALRPPCPPLTREIKRGRFLCKSVLFVFGMSHMICLPFQCCGCLFYWGAGVVMENILHSFTSFRLWSPGVALDEELDDVDAATVPCAADIWKVMI